MKDSQCRNLIEIMRSYSEPHSSYFYSTIYYERHKTFISTGSRLCWLRDLWYVYSVKRKEVSYWLTERWEELDLSTATFPIIHKKVKIRHSIEECEIKKENKELNTHHLEQRAINWAEMFIRQHRSHHDMFKNELREETPPPIQPSLWGQIKALFSHTKWN